MNIRFKVRIERAARINSVPGWFPVMGRYASWSFRENGVVSRPIYRCYHFITMMSEWTGMMK